MELAHRQAGADEVEALLHAALEEALDVAAAIVHAEGVVDRVAHEERRLAGFEPEAPCFAWGRLQKTAGLARRNFKVAATGQLRSFGRDRMRDLPATDLARIETNTPNAIPVIEAGNSGRSAARDW